ncbi:FixJ family two-component response regulator/DNA-binding MarR family transcriptional regulator [Novosphingobium hassiacum]|uniref:FixJ family two-component response regulator/DNA-binding MarR family transcriptional regulator n=1 Tax=Novosphingobium hassiacum TaxID=173676 RepID=A0A7W6A0Z9_9SPHN|nr:response regulator [Novosphingobium hassiacum]MBB3862738.1 FixJ family two-component response regulator/DNA-binding MarR family transcriptional regulator [Novosphingobium hassiacum]
MSFADRAFEKLTPLPEGSQCEILIVDDDEECLDEYAEMIEALGYPCQKTTSPGHALRMIADNPRIGIVLADFRMPLMDGVTMLEELSARFASLRPIVAIIITGDGSLDVAVQAMRSNAIDFLTKPVGRNGLAASLRRAATRWAQLVGQFNLAQILARRDLVHAPIPIAAATRREAREPTPEELQAFVRSIIKSRKSRSTFLDTSLFADPAWDILLELASAGLKQKAVPPSSVCAATQVPFTTALRYVRQLVAAGLVRRWQDPEDKRRTLLALEPTTLEAITGYLVSMWHSHGIPVG